MTAGHLLLLGLCLSLFSCQRPNDLRIPADATRYVTAQRVEHLVAFADVPALDGFDGTAPGWMFCDRGVCALGGKPAGSYSGELDGGDRVITWSPAGKDQIQALARWREGSGRSLSRKHASDAAMRGRLDAGYVLGRLKFENPRAKEIVERASHQLERIDFDADFEGDDLDATVRLVPRPGEPRFVTGLGAATGNLSQLGGLVEPGVAGILRVSADPDAIWALLRSTVDAASRADLDDFLAALRTEFGVDLQDALLANLTGHFVVVAYAAEVGKSPLEWLTGQATREAVYIGITNPDALRRILDAATQLSRGRLNTQRVDGERTQWAWVEEGELKWTVMLGSDSAVIVDSPVAFQHARRFETQPAPIDEALVARGVGELLDGRQRSGIYLDATVLTSLLGSDGWWSHYRWVTIVADESGPTEVVRLRVGTFKDH